ncbi:MAG TPA: tetratricopeptide repeat protein [Puia sp.]|nr:tetratricopeptide repeat protein [Puia sp.]
MKARIIILSGLLLPLLSFGQKRYDFNNNCRQAYQAIIQLRLEEGERLLEAEKKRDPANLIPYFLDNYIDFFQLFFNEDPVLYQAAKNRLDQRIRLMSEGPESSPFNLFTRSIIHFQWAAIKIKFGSNWDAGWEFRRSFLQSKECEKKFPVFGPARMLSGAMQVVAGTIPDGYKWLSNLLGIRGNVEGGMVQLESFLEAGDPARGELLRAGRDSWAELYRDEAIFYYLYLQFYIRNKHEEVFQFIRQHKLDVKNNHLFTYLYANLSLNDHRSAVAEQIISQMNTAPVYMDMPVWELEMGYARLNHLDPAAAGHLERFLQRFKGRFYVKDALEKLSWSYYLNGDLRKADSCRLLVLRKGTAESDADRQALKNARGGNWPAKKLLQARLLSDGGYYAEALQSIQGMASSDFVLPEEKCELAYRLGRIYDGLGRNDEAIGAYLTAIKTGEHLTAYYAARAALQTGYIYEQRGDKVKAIAFFQKCLSLKDHDYKNSLDQRAKAGIARCKGE